jgi:hypothetical protein
MKKGKLCTIVSIMVICAFGLLSMNCSSDDGGKDTPGGGSTVATPTATPGAGTYTSAQSVTLTSTAGASIYYTIDGSTPSTSSTLYSSPINISVTTTLKAIAVKEGMTNSGIFSALYTINTPQNTVITPTATPPAGTYTSAQNVALSCATNGANIYYTIDGSTPSSSSILYSSAISIGVTTTLKAIAVKDGMTNSGILEAGYTINIPPNVVLTPTATPGAGTYYIAQNVTLACATNGASIYYTINGGTPTTSDTLYSDPIAINVTTTLKAIAVKDGMDNSGILEAQYTILLGTASISITFAQIADAAYGITIDSPALHRFNGDSSASITLDNAAQYDVNSVSWKVNGVEIGTGGSVTLNAENPLYSTFGTHYLTLNVKKDGVPYNKIIPFTVEY